jgi:predicted transcriptional regulator
MARAIIEIPEPQAYFDAALATAARVDAGEALPETDYRLGFSDAAHLFATLTPERLALIESLLDGGPRHIANLATALERPEDLVQRDIGLLADLRLVETDNLGRIAVPWDAVEVHLAFGHAEV